MLQEKDVPKPRIKIIDFGLAQQLEDGITFKSLCGTPQYIGTGLAHPWGATARGGDRTPRHAGREVAGWCCPSNVPPWLCVCPQLLK